VSVPRREIKRTRLVRARCLWPGTSGALRAPPELLLYYWPVLIAFWSTRTPGPMVAATVIRRK
jgi:hypothetical protein